MKPSKFGAFARSWLDQLAPCHCRLCGLASGRGIDLCLACEGELPWLVQTCQQCALPLAVPSPLCADCLDKPPAFDRCMAAVSYTEPVSHWIHAAKYHGDFAVLAVLASLLLRAVNASRTEEPLPDLICPMPLHWRRRWRRGFNQAEEIARVLGRQIDVPIDIRAARRIRATPPQRQLDARARQANLRGAFEITASLEGRSVAIVDDVLTTGASANALALAMKKAGAAHVTVWACARTP